MKKTCNFNFLVLILALLAVACQPDELAYKRPSSLEGPIYQQLESTGEFSYYLECLDKTDYATSLAKGGSWTVFAFDDTAFELYMKDNGYASIDDIPVNRLENMIKYSIIIDAYSTTTLTYYPAQWYLGTSFRRRTQYSDSVIQMSTDGYVNELNEPNQTYMVDESRGREKTTNYFLDEYVNYSGTEVEFEDYAYMFPGEEYVANVGDMKVFEAHVVNIGVVAENGLIYHLDKVLEPRDNLYQHVSRDAQLDKYSTFKSIIDRFGYFNYTYTDEETSDSIYQLRFLNGVTNNYLAFEPNDENMPYLINNVDRTLANAPGILAPTNTALANYLNSGSIIGDYYTSYDDMPLDVLGKFINTNFFTYYWNICPSHFGSSFTVGLDEIDLQAEDVEETYFCSNGLFVGSNKVFESTSFSTVMGPLLLDQDYSIMLQAVKVLGIDKALLSTGVDYSIFGIRNDQFINVPDPNSSTRKVTVVEGPENSSITYLQVTGDSNNSNNRIYPDPDEATPSTVDIAYVYTTLASIVENQIVEQAFDMGDTYYQTMSGEYVQVSSNGSQVAGGGNITDASPVSITSTRVTENGNFYGMSSFIERPKFFTYGTLLQDEPTYSKFLEVLSGANAKVKIADYSQDFLVSFINTSKNYTLFVPTNEAVQQAVDDGVIPDPTSSSLSSLSLLERAQATVDLLAFAKAHFVLVSVPTDGVTSGTFTSTYYSEIINLKPLYVEYEVENNGTSLTIKNATTGEVEAETTNITNVLSKKVVIHQIDNYLKYPDPKN